MDLARDKKRLVVLLALPALLLLSIVLLAIELTRAGSADLSSPTAGAQGVTAQGVSPAAPGGTLGSRAADPAPRQGALGQVTITAVGDIVMGTTVNGFPPRGGSAFFDDVRKSLSGDVVLGNLEGTLSKGGSPRCEKEPSSEGASAGPREGCFAFQTPPAGARWLRDAGFTVVSLANKHAYDYGPSGLSQTVGALERAGVSYTGMPGQVTLQRVGDVVVAIVGFSAQTHTPDLRDIPAAEYLIRNADAEADVVVVTMHADAGGRASEHVEAGAGAHPGAGPADAVSFAHAVVDAGADLVVGHGPHVLRGLEWYQGRLIAYSLGNFGAYNVFNLAGPRQFGGILKVRLNADGTWARGKLVPTYLKGKGIPVLDPDRTALRIVHELSAEDFGGSAVEAVRGRLVPPGGDDRPPGESPA